MILSDKIKLRLLGFSLLGILMCLLNPPVHAVRCGNNLINKGDLAIQVKQYCGEPDWVDRWYDEIVVGEDTDFEHRTSNVIERWVYNLGPNDFIRFITIRNNRVVKIESGDYGFNPVYARTNCDTNHFSLGMKTVEVREKCGEPDSTTRRLDTSTTPLAPGVRQKTTVAVDEWVYNYGPQNFLRILTFYNGELVNIETGPRGF